MLANHLLYFSKIKYLWSEIIKFAMNCVSDALSGVVCDYYTYYIENVARLKRSIRPGPVNNDSTKTRDQYKESPIVRRIQMFQILLNEQASNDSKVIKVIDTFSRRRQRRATRAVARKLAA